MALWTGKEWFPWPINYVDQVKARRNARFATVALALISIAATQLVGQDLSTMEQSSGFEMPSDKQLEFISLAGLVLGVGFAVKSLYHQARLYDYVFNWKHG